MSQKRGNSGNALQETLGDRILAALTQQEITQLLDSHLAPVKLNVKTATTCKGN